MKYFWVYRIGISMGTEGMRPCSFWLNLGFASFGIFIGVMLYLTVWVRYVEGVFLEWEVYCPRVLYMGAISGLVTWIACVNACLSQRSRESTFAAMFKRRVSFPPTLGLWYLCRFTLGLWPVYGILTIPILGVLFFGTLMLSHFIPVW